MSQRSFKICSSVKIIVIAIIVLRFGSSVVSAAELRSLQETENLIAENYLNKSLVIGDEDDRQISEISYTRKGLTVKIAFHTTVRKFLDGTAYHDHKYSYYKFSLKDIDIERSDSGIYFKCIKGSHCIQYREDETRTESETVTVTSDNFGFVYRFSLYLAAKGDPLAEAFARMKYLLVPTSPTDDLINN